MNNKLLIGFTTKTSAKWPKFFCPLFKHCVVIDDGILIQVGTDRIKTFRVGKKEIKKLEENGWVFVRIQSIGHKVQNTKYGFQLLTCVGFAKRVIGIRSPFILTPDQLYRQLTMNN